MDLGSERLKEVKRRVPFLSSRSHSPLFISSERKRAERIGAVVANGGIRTGKGSKNPRTIESRLFVSNLTNTSESLHKKFSLFGVFFSKKYLVTGLARQQEKLQGSAVLRTSDKVLVASIIWQLHNSTLEWAYSGNEILNEFNWTVSLCQITDWSFTSKLDGKWTFQLGNLILDQPFGRKIIVLDTPFEKQVEFINLRTQNIPEFDNNRIPDDKKYLRLRRSRVDKENFSHSNATPAEKWEIVQAVLDRVFGNSEDIRRNGWVSHLNIFNILGRIFGLDQLFNRSPLAPTTTEANSATEPDAETVNTNFLRRFPGARIKS
ncbi:uncharacterized protein LOC111062164 [Nilaparvata lugens]|uniref:uncharacterized protein LOC111062164 n=1 Tax=Nilaparvata lugens TaxID=108931 RepID=UPI00193E14E5|nr:uncharacterized protein LOC111062164 [Nilaparvata lugens]